METKRVLFVMPEGMQEEFSELLPAGRVEWIGALSCAEARMELIRNPRIPAIVCNHTLPDGSWYCMLREMVHRGLDANLLVVLPAGCNSRTVESHGIHVVLNYPPEPLAGKWIVEAAESVEVSITAS